MSLCLECKEEKPDVVTLPNGHTYCEQCADRVCREVMGGLMRGLETEMARRAVSEPESGEQR
jgi:hypothetical protein